jgi:glycosyltransferase involved in cell wall biosynthesis
MRVTFVLPPVDMSGGIKVVAIYAKALADKGHDVVLVSPPPKAVSLKRKLKAVVSGQGWPGEEKRPSHFDGLGFDHRILDRWRPVTNTDVSDADVVIATWWETAEWVDALNESKGAKVYFIQHHEVFDYLPVERCKATYRLPCHKIVVARWLVDVMRDQYGDSKVDLVPNAVDHDQFYADVRGKQSAPTVGFLFHSATFKGVDVTLRAIEQLRGNFSSLRVISFGAKMPNEDLIENGLIEFHHLPAQKKLRELYAQCDVWITASRSEGFNLPAMEAMACRTPVVATRTGWPEEAIIPGKNGVLVDIDNIDDLARGVENVLNLSDVDWRQMSLHAFETVASSSWDASATLFEEALKNACVRANRGEIRGRCKSPPAMVDSPAAITPDSAGSRT